MMTLTDASLIWNLDWKTVKEIDKRSIQDKLVDLKTINPTIIGVDEIAYQKGHKYLTVVRDIPARKVIWIGFNRKTETLDEFFQELGPEKSMKIQVCCMVSSRKSGEMYKSGHKYIMNCVCDPAGFSFSPINNT
jgi:transposase